MSNSTDKTLTIGTDLTVNCGAFWVPPGVACSLFSGNLVSSAEWTDLSQYLVVSDGSYSLGDTSKSFNDTRDQGSKIVYFNSTAGDNDSADVYWWDGAQLVDSQGSATNPENDQPYGTDPLNPNEVAIRSFQSFIAENHDRIKTQRHNSWEFGQVAGGYPDWFLFRRGETFDTFDNDLAGGRSPEEPMVVSSYGPIAEPRAVLAAVGGNTPFAGPLGSDPATNFYWFHQVVKSIECHSRYGWVDTNNAFSAYNAGPITALLEDFYVTKSGSGGLYYLPQNTVVRKSVIAHNTDMGYFTGDDIARAEFDTVIFYRNGFASNTLTDPDPVHDKFVRNIYQAGGAQLGHVYRNMISASGGSGGPQMRFGAILEDSLIIEGYFYCSSRSGGSGNPWLEANNQTGQSCIVRNNVAFPYVYPSPNDPDTYGVSDTDAHTGDGFGLQAASFGADVSSNIISGSMMIDDLGGTIDQVRKGLRITMEQETYNDGNIYTQKNNTMENNIVYRAKAALQLEGIFSGSDNNVVQNNVFVSDTLLSRYLQSSVTPTNLLIDSNRVYSDNALPTDNYLTNNTLSSYSAAAATEGWGDPDRTLKRYVVEELGLTLLDWSDDPFLDPTEVQVRVTAGEAYDPTGLKTFMAVAEHMRLGGGVIPSSGKPSLTGDYAFDERFTAKAVVNYVRAGFNMQALS